LFLHVPAVSPIPGDKRHHLSHCTQVHLLLQEAAVEYVAATICGGLEADRAGEQQQQQQQEAMEGVQQQPPQVAYQPQQQLEEEGGEGELDMVTEAPAAAAAGSPPQDDEERVLTPPDPELTQSAAAGGGGIPAAGSSGSWPVLYVVSTYVIGKERLLLEVARRSGVTLGVTAQKLEVLR
jgi:hypothetical protein